MSCKLGNCYSTTNSLAYPPDRPAIYDCKGAADGGNCVAVRG